MSWDRNIISGPIEARAFLGLDEDGQPQFGDLLPVYNLNMVARAYREEWAAYRIFPTQPKDTFAGDDPAAMTLTVCLQFADEAEAQSVLGEFWVEDALATP